MQKDKKIAKANLSDKILMVICMCVKLKSLMFLTVIVPDADGGGGLAGYDN